MTLDWNISYSIPLDVAGFDDTWPGLNSSTAIEVTAEELVWSAMMVGYPGQVLDFWALLHRASIVLAYLSAPGRLPLMGIPIQQSHAFEESDLSEKGAISYYLGLFAAKAIAARLLDIPWLVHYDFYLRSHGQAATGRRPDLIGVSQQGPAPGSWFAVEAKGRSHDLKDGKLAAAFADAKFQLSQARIPKPVGAGIASIATFRSKEWRVAWQDPEPIGDEPLDAAGHARFLAAYYEPVLHFARQMTRLAPATPIQLATRPDAAPSRGVTYVAVDVPESHLHVAVPAGAVEGTEDQPMASDAAVDAFMASCETLVWPEAEQETAQPEGDRAASPWVTAMPAAFDDSGRRWSLGIDGVAVRLG